MGRISRLLGGTATVLRLLRGRSAPPSGQQRTPAAPSRGRTGAEATVEVDPSVFAGLPCEWAPRPDGRPDPGEVVWTWVPYEENDGRGKDRPVLLVAREGASLIGVQLTSKPHDDRPDHADFVPVGAGGWDSEGRPSWAAVDRVLRVFPAGMRREGTALERDVFETVTARLRQRYGARG